MWLIYWIVVGLIAGWLAGKGTQGDGMDLLLDLFLGVLGSILVGWVFGRLGIWPGRGLIGFMIVAFISAAVLVWISRLPKKA